MKKILYLLPVILILYFPLQANAEEPTALLSGAYTITNNVGGYPEISIIGGYSDIDNFLAQYAAIPDAMKGMFRDNNISICLTDIALTTNGSSIGGYAMYDTNNKNYYIFVTDKNGTLNNFYHETGHAFNDFNNQIPTEMFNMCWLLERDKYLDNVGSHPSAYSKTNEYFADIFRAYFVNQEKLIKYCPISYQLVDFYVQSSFIGSSSGHMIPLKAYKDQIPTALYQPEIVYDEKQDNYISKFYAKINQQREAQGLTGLIVIPDVQPTVQELCNIYARTGSVDSNEISNVASIIYDVIPETSTGSWFTWSFTNSKDIDIPAKLVSAFSPKLVDPEQKSFVMAISKDTTNMWSVLLIVIK